MIYLSVLYSTHKQQTYTFRTTFTHLVFGHFMMSLQVIQITYLIAVGINVLILAPISLYYLYQLWSLRKESLLSKRYPYLTVLYVYRMHCTHPFENTIDNFSFLLFPLKHVNIPFPHSFEYSIYCNIHWFVIICIIK